tara:strand:- start:85 stop:321 length:237 start_codon:yes stop_codon:yes gene_type:complete
MTRRKFDRYEQARDLVESMYLEENVYPKIRDEVAKKEEQLENEMDEIRLNQKSKGKDKESASWPVKTERKSILYQGKE